MIFISISFVYDFQKTKKINLDSFRRADRENIYFLMRSSAASIVTQVEKYICLSNLCAAHYLLKIFGKFRASCCWHVKKNNHQLLKTILSNEIFALFLEVKQKQWG